MKNINKELTTMKEIYTSPESEIIMFDDKDIITESDETQIIDPNNDTRG